MENIIDNINYIETLPNEVILEIMKKLPDKDIPTICRLNKRFSQLCNNEHFWKTKRLGTIEKFSLEGNMSNKSEKKKYETMKGLTKIASLSGVKVENLGNKLSLDLKDMNLCVLPKEIGYLKNLRGLYLSNNNLSVLPKEIGNLKNLEVLYLSNNRLSVLPSSIALLQNLQYIYLENNKLSVLPKEIGQLKNLQYLYLDNNRLSIDEIKRISKLLPNIILLYY